MNAIEAESVVDMAFGWAEIPKRSVCGIAACPTTKGSYCCECHATAYSAANQIRLTALAWMRSFLPGVPSPPAKAAP